MSAQIDFLARLEGDLRTAAARTARQPLRRRRAALLVAPRALLVAGLVLLMGGSLALAFGGRVLTALGHDPAPSPVRSEFKRMVKPFVPLDGAPPSWSKYMPGKIVPGSEHRVLTVPTSLGTVASLYAARTVRGQVCIVIRGLPFTGGGCASPATARGPFAMLLPAKWSRRQGLIRATLVGRARSLRAVTLRVVYEGGGHTDVALGERWFMYEVPKAHLKRAVAPARLDVLAADGTRLGSFADPLLLARRPAPRFTKPVPASIQLLATAELPNGGGTVRISSGRDAGGDNCFVHLRNGKTQVFPAWECTPRVGRYGFPLFPADPKHYQDRVAVWWQLGLANNQDKPVGYGYAYATGWVAPEVATLTLRMQDGSASEIPLHDRYYLYVVPPANWPNGHRPSILEARDAAGRIVYRQFLYPRQHCVYPGVDRVCRHRSMGTG